jgi:hypothetical protein
VGLTATRISKNQQYSSKDQMAGQQTVGKLEPGLPSPEETQLSSLLHHSRRANHHYWPLLRGPMPWQLEIATRTMAFTSSSQTQIQTLFKNSKH